MVVLYTNHCPRCIVVKDKLEKQKIEYTLVDDENILNEKGFDFMPVLQVGETFLTSMIDINNYINKQGTGI